MVLRPKLIGIDLDGTLLRRDHSVSECNRNALIHCLNEGILVYFVTGRPYCFSKHLARQIDSRIKVISSNGGIYEIGNRCVENDIDERVLLDVIEVLQQTQMKAFFKGWHDFYTHESYDERFLYDHYNQEYEQDIKVHAYTQLSFEDIKKQAHHIVKVLVYHMEEARLIQARKRIECITGVEVTDYQSISFDITAHQVNKGNILKQVLQEYGITKEECMAIGDGHNDIVMLQEAGIRVGMKNACDEVKQCCDYICADYMQDGVAEAIQHFLG